MKLGVVGCGHLGSIHARVYTEIPGVTLCGVHDIDPATSAAVAERHGCMAYESLTALAAEADALSICVPTTEHCEVALAAMEHQCHLLVEKPIADDIESGKRMVAEADKRGLQMMVGHVERFNPAIIAALPYFNRPGFVESHRLAPFGHRGAEVAVVLDLMIHDIDLLTMILGEPVDDLRASGISVLTPDLDIANARIEFKGGCVANITASRISRERLRKVRFFQSDSYISIDLLAGQVEMFRKAPDFGTKLSQAIATPEGLAGISLESFVEPVPITVTPAEPLRLELEAFVRAIEGDKPVPISGADGLRSLEIAYRILEHVRSGR